MDLDGNECAINSSSPPSSSLGVIGVQTPMSALMRSIATAADDAAARGGGFALAYDSVAATTQMVANYLQRNGQVMIQMASAADIDAAAAARLNAALRQMGAEAGTMIN